MNFAALIYFSTSYADLNYVTADSMYCGYILVPQDVHGVLHTGSPCISEGLGYAYIQFSTYLLLAS
jgi:hypothetical protein